MAEKIIVPAKEVKLWIDSIITNEFKTGKFKWVMRAGTGDLLIEVGDLIIEVEEGSG